MRNPFDVTPQLLTLLVQRCIVPLSNGNGHFLRNLKGQDVAHACGALAYTKPPRPGGFVEDTGDLHAFLKGILELHEDRLIRRLLRETREKLAHARREAALAARAVEDTQVFYDKLCALFNADPDSSHEDPKV